MRQNAQGRALSSQAEMETLFHGIAMAYWMTDKSLFCPPAELLEITLWGG
jgi:hypothetical protein